jgi:hypothetical protein
VIKNLPRRQYHVRVPPEVHPSIGELEYNLRHLPPYLRCLRSKVVPAFATTVANQNLYHRLKRGSRTPGASSSTLGRSIGTLSKKKATRMEPNANSPVPVDRQWSSCAIIFSYHGQVRMRIVTFI